MMKHTYSMIAMCSLYLSVIGSDETNNPKTEVIGTCVIQRTPQGPVLAPQRGSLGLWMETNTGMDLVGKDEKSLGAVISIENPTAKKNAGSVVYIAKHTPEVKARLLAQQTQEAVSK